MVYGVKYKIGDEIFNQEANKGMFKEDALRELGGIVKKEADNVGIPLTYQFYEKSEKNIKYYHQETMNPRKKATCSTTEKKEEDTAIDLKTEYANLMDRYIKLEEECSAVKRLLAEEQSYIEKIEKDNVQLEKDNVQLEKERKILLEENDKMRKDLAYVAVESIKLMGDMRYGKKD